MSGPLVNHSSSCYYVYSNLLQGNKILYQRNRLTDKTSLGSRKDKNTMKYDFTTVLDRKGKDSIAVEPFEADWIKWPGTVKEGFDIIPMWVADMNFPAVHTIPEAIIERTKHTTYGYFSPREEYFDAIIQWHKNRNGVEGLKPKHIGYENGVFRRCSQCVKCTLL